MGINLQPSPLENHNGVDGKPCICNCMVVYTIEFSEEAVEELIAVRAYDQAQIVKAIGRHLSYQPAAQTRNRKMLESLVASFEAVPPIWELRVGEYRVFYDVDDSDKKVYIRAIRRKPPHKTTGEIL